jgi:hypothetical protein
LDHASELWSKDPRRELAFEMAKASYTAPVNFPNHPAVKLFSRAGSTTVIAVGVVVPIGYALSFATRMANRTEMCRVNLFGKSDESNAWSWVVASAVPTRLRMLELPELSGTGPLGLGPLIVEFFRL